MQATIEDATASIGYVIAASHWGRGYGTEAVAWLIKELKAIGIRSFAASVERANLASLKILARMGFQVQSEDAGELRVVMRA